MASMTLRKVGKHTLLFSKSQSRHSHCTVQEYLVEFIRRRGDLHVWQIVRKPFFCGGYAHCAAEGNTTEIVEAPRQFKSRSNCAVSGGLSRPSAYVNLFAEHVVLQPMHRSGVVRDCRDLAAFGQCRLSNQVPGPVRPMLWRLSVLRNALPTRLSC